MASDLIERLRAATMGFDWSDLPDDACIPAIPLLREAATALAIERERAEKAEALLEVQIAGHRLSAKDATRNLIRATKAEAELAVCHDAKHSSHWKARAESSELIERELRERAEWRSQNEGPFTKVNLIEWRAADHICRLLDHIAELEAMTDESIVTIARMGYDGDGKFTATAVFTEAPAWPVAVVWNSLPVRMSLPTSPKGGPDHG